MKLFLWMLEAPIELLRRCQRPIANDFRFQILGAMDVSPWVSTQNNEYELNP